MNVESIIKISLEFIEGKVKQGKIPRYCYGKRAERVIKALDKWFKKKGKTTENTELTEKLTTWGTAGIEN